MPCGSICSCLEDDDCKQLTDGCAGRFGGVDYLVANAGISMALKGIRLRRGPRADAAAERRFAGAASQRLPRPERHRGGGRRAPDRLAAAG